MLVARKVVYFVRTEVVLIRRPLCPYRTPMHATRPVQNSSRHDRLSGIATAIGAVAFLPFGLWAMFAPRSFFDQLAKFEPYNQHFIQDIGAFQLGLGAALALSAFRPRREGATVALLGGGIGAAAHAVSHVVGHDLGGKPASDIPMFTVIAVVLLAAGVLRARSEPTVVLP